MPERLSIGGMRQFPMRLVAARAFWRQPARNMERERYVNAKEVAEFLQASPKTILRLANLGIIPAHHFGEGLKHRRWRFLISEVDEWMRSRKAPIR